jgi:hypothetical protein
MVAEGTGIGVGGRGLGGSVGGTGLGVNVDGTGVGGIAVGGAVADGSAVDVGCDVPQADRSNATTIRVTSGETRFL